MFGIFLGVPVPQLKKIESSYSLRELERYKINMLLYWLENKLAPTWNEVVQALEQSDQLVLAAQVKLDYLWSTTVDEEQGNLAVKILNGRYYTCFYKVVRVTSRISRACQ